MPTQGRTRPDCLAQRVALSVTDDRHCVNLARRTIYDESTNPQHFPHTFACQVQGRRCELGESALDLSRARNADMPRTSSNSLSPKRHRKWESCRSAPATRPPGVWRFPDAILWTVEANSVRRPRSTSGSPSHRSCPHTSVPGCAREPSPPSSAPVGLKSRRNRLSSRARRSLNQSPQLARASF